MTRLHSIGLTGWIIEVDERDSGSKGMTRLHSIGLTGYETGQFELRLDGVPVVGVTRVRLEMGVGEWTKLEVELLGGGVVFAGVDGAVDVVVDGADGVEALGVGV